jgi:hypothetical protein
MDCQQTREKLSVAADKELPDRELRQVTRHLAECAECRREFDEQGALDMLLKSHFSHEPPEGYFDALWPSVSERLDGEAGGDSAPPPGGGSKEDEVVFKSSPAMQFLNIPERRPPASTAETRTATAPEVQASPWRWPVALMVSTVIVVAGYLAYVKLMPAKTEVVPAVALETEPAPPVEPIAEPGAASQPATQVAALTPTGDGGLPGASPDENGEVDDTPGKREGAAARARARRRAHHGRGRAKGKDKAPEPKAAEDKPKAAEAKKEPKKPAAPGKKTALDSLLDDAIGSGGDVATKKKATAAAPTPASDLPEQLNMNQIRNAMNKVKGRVQACYDQYQVEGMANVGFTILGSGGIKDVSIRGKFRGTDTGACVVKAVQQATFPKFSGKPISIKSYPFLLQ